MTLQQLISLGFLFAIFLFLFFIRHTNRWHYLALREIEISHCIIIGIALVATILVATLPMSLSPYWTGEIKIMADKQQFDRMGDALMQGHLYIDNGDIDPALKNMENPYNRKERERLGVKYHWDEAYYNHHYYMYFGVVPTLITFIPFKFLTGTSLLSYQATQIFTAFTIIGLFYLFFILSRRFFPSFPFSLYLLLSSSFSILSISYSIAAPGLYCTAIVSAVCLMVWSIICFFKGVGLNETIDTKYLCLGAFLGALTFGCRPPVGLANCIVITVGFIILGHEKLTKFEKWYNVACLLLPYVFVGVLLMLYNYARFDNVFEFGQSYQLTVVDQHNYRSFFENFDLVKIVNVTLANFFATHALTDSFPYVRFNGVFINFPILLFSVKLFSDEITEVLHEKNLYLTTLIMFLLPFLITILDAYWSPVFLERYCLDFYYLLCVVSFINIASWLEKVSGVKKRILLYSITILSFAVFVTEFLFFCIPFDGNYTDCYPEALTEIYSGLRLGF